VLFNWISDGLLWRPFCVRKKRTARCDREISDGRRKHTRRLAGRLPSGDDPGRLNLHIYYLDSPVSPSPSAPPPTHLTICPPRRTLHSASDAGGDFHRPCLKDAIWLRALCPSHPPLLHQLPEAMLAIYYQLFIMQRSCRVSWEHFASRQIIFFFLFLKKLTQFTFIKRF